MSSVSTRLRCNTIGLGRAGFKPPDTTIHYSLLCCRYCSRCLLCQSVFGASATPKDLAGRGFNLRAHHTQQSPELWVLTTLGVCCINPPSVKVQHYRTWPGGVSTSGHTIHISLLSCGFHWVSSVSIRLRGNATGQVWPGGLSNPGPLHLQVSCAVGTNYTRCLLVCINPSSVQVQHCIYTWPGRF